MYTLVCCDYIQVLLPRLGPVSNPISWQLKCVVPDQRDGVYVAVLWAGHDALGRHEPGQHASFALPTRSFHTRKHTHTHTHTEHSQLVGDFVLASFKGKGNPQTSVDAVEVHYRRTKAYVIRSKRNWKCTLQKKKMTSVARNRYVDLIEAAAKDQSVLASRTNKVKRKVWLMLVFCVSPTHSPKQDQQIYHTHTHTHTHTHANTQTHEHEV